MSPGTPEERDPGLTPDELFDIDIFESQYARDLEGRLIRIEPATHRDLQTIWTVTVDGRTVQVPKATPATDDQGNLLRGAEGRVVPRLTTIYDAAARAYSSAEGLPVGAGDVNPIPVLCHQGHVRPVGVCRICSVLTSRGGKAGARMVPACHHPVVDGMEVHTPASEMSVQFPGEPEPRPAGGHVRDTVKVLVQLLAANHLHAAQRNERRYQNELLDLARRFGVTVQAGADQLRPETPFTRPLEQAPQRRTVDESSPVIAFDSGACILCDRCVRACSEVKPFKIIGHTGFGREARISFDLGQPMAESGCVSCGECAVACPTGALTFKGTIYQGRDPWHDTPAPRPQTVRAEELAQIPLFAGVPYAFLKWNEGSVGRLHCPSARDLCRQDDYATTAFVIEQGSVEVLVNDKRVAVRTGDSEDFIVGEMACLTHQPRNATLRALPETTVLVLRRNMLHMLQRNRQARLILYPAYRRRALETYLARGQLFRGLTEEENHRCVHFLQGRASGVEFLQVDPGQLILRQGEPADSFYIINLGHVRVSEMDGYGRELVRDYLQAGEHFGEIGLLSRLVPDVGERMPEAQRGRRTGTCTALDHVQLVRIDDTAFAALLAQEPAVADRLRQTCMDLVRRNREIRTQVGHRAAEFTAAGLYQGQSLLVLDLHRCTRCQECVRACADTHGGVTRLLLEGNRFGAYLVPSACRSCRDPVCLIGCPVDAIHRRPADPSRPGAHSLAIVIEDHCIGCGLCAHNCPFGSIHMTARPATGTLPAARLATNCDLCESLDGRPRCVHHCPHEAALRLDARAWAVDLGLNPLQGAQLSGGQV
jgi:Fe-S-cluster-containing hydrogenase component 2/CRP-like cAMP-binding protein